MTTLQNKLSSEYTLLSRTTMHNKDLLLLISKSSKGFLTTEMDRIKLNHSGTKSFKTAEHAYRDYFTRIADSLNLNRQSLSLLLLTPEIEFPDHALSTFPAKNQTTAMQTNLTNTFPTAESQTPQSLQPEIFYSQTKLPLWLEATQSFLLTCPQITIHKGTLYKLLLTNITSDANETNSTIHLEAPDGMLVEINLATACLYFRKATPTA